MPVTTGCRLGHPAGRGGVRGGGLLPGLPPWWLGLALAWEMGSGGPCLISTAHPSDILGEQRRGNESGLLLAQQSSLKPAPLTSCTL